MDKICGKESKNLYDKFPDQIAYYWEVRKSSANSNEMSVLEQVAHIKPIITAKLP